MVALLLALGLLVPSAAAPRSASPAPKPNLRGEVMILVYHNFSDTKTGQWFRRLSDFDHDLERLDAQGYRPITLRQYITGDTATPPGTTPVVLTFDDGSKFQMRFTPDGQLDPDCAVAHWVAFAKTHPEFPVHGTFFVNAGDDVFSQKAFIAKKLKMLVDMGSEIGNHTYTHPNLRKISQAQIEREIGLGQYYIDHWLPDYPVTSFALPFGIAPRPDSLAVESEWTGAPRPKAAPVTVRWHYSAVVLVGSGPAPSPLVAGLDGANLPRVQVFDPEFDHWLGYFQAHPDRRFVSDGEAHKPGSLTAAARVPRRGAPKVY